MDPYGNAANQYGQEMMYGTRLQAGLDQQKAEFPNQLYDRFMQAYQQQIRQKQLDAEMARKQQHEDTYLKMAQRGEERDNDVAKAKFADWISNNYKEGRDDGMAILLGKTAGLDPDSVKAMLPKGTYAKAPSAPDTQVEYNGETLNLPNPAMPSMEESYTPGRGQRVAYQEGEQARKSADEQRKAEYGKARIEIQNRLAKIKEESAVATDDLTRIRATLEASKLENLNRMLEAGGPEAEVALKNARTANYGSLMGERGTSKPSDPLNTELKLNRLAEKAVPKDVFGNRDPKAVTAQVEKLRSKLVGAKAQPKTGADPLVGTKTKYPSGTKLKDGRSITVDANGIIVRVE